MRKSEYVQRLEREENQRFDQEQKKKSLQKIYDQNAGNLDKIEANYHLTDSEREMLKDIQTEQEHQQKLDEAFLKGFTGN